MRNSIAYILLLWIISTSLFAQAPAGYYSTTTGLYGDSLKAALHDIIDNHTPMAYDQLHGLYPFTDSRMNNTVWDMYSDIPGGTLPYVFYFVSSDQCGNYSQEGDCYNREHSFPKSWFGGEVMPMHTDLFHVYPTDGYVNGQRGNLPYGETNSPSWTSQNGSKRGPCSISGYSGTVFEPIDAYKGDFARSYFYMAVRYYGEDSNWPGSPMVNGAEPLPWALDMLLQWHQQDSVSAKEISRNNAVYSYQGNRNPFIDKPYFAERIWTTSAGLAEYPAKPEVNIHPNPASNFLRISVKNDEGLFEVQLIDASGRLIRNGKQIHGNQELTLDISKLKSGPVIIQLRDTESGYAWHYKALLLP